MDTPGESGYAPVNGQQLYWESYGSGGTPVVIVQGGFGSIGMSPEIIGALAEDRQVIALELQGHGHTPDIDRPFSYEAFGDDIALTIDHLQLGRADLVGHSLGAGSSLRTAIQHPDRLRKVVLVSFPCRRDGWFPDVRVQMDQVGSAMFAQARHSLMYRLYAEVAPDPDGFPALMDKTGELLRRPYDWTEEVRELAVETMLVYADADSISVTHMADFYALLGGGLRDAGWDASGRVSARLGVLPGLTHYDIFNAPALIEAVRGFLG